MAASRAALLRPRYSDTRLHPVSLMLNQTFLNMIGGLKHGCHGHQVLRACYFPTRASPHLAPPAKKRSYFPP